MNKTFNVVLRCYFEGSVNFAVKAKNAEAAAEKAEEMLDEQGTVPDALYLTYVEPISATPSADPAKGAV